MSDHTDLLKQYGGLKNKEEISTVRTNRLSYSLYFGDFERIRRFNVLRVFPKISASIEEVEEHVPENLVKLDTERNCITYAVREDFEKALGSAEEDVIEVEKR